MPSISSTVNPTILLTDIDLITNFLTDDARMRNFYLQRLQKIQNFRHVYTLCSLNENEKIVDSINF